MLNKDILNAFRYNFDKNKENPYLMSKLHSRIRIAIEEELPVIFHLEELDELQWEYIRNQLVEIVDNILLMKVKYLPKTDDERNHNESQINQLPKTYR